MFDVGDHGTHWWHLVRVDFCFILMTRMGVKMKQKPETGQTVASAAITDVRPATPK